MTNKSPIREAAEAVSDYVTDALDVATGFEDEIEAIIQRVLRERVPEKTTTGGLTMYPTGVSISDDEAIGYNQCRKEIGL